MEASRKMIYPYTLTAKMLQFPLKFYYKKNPYFQSWIQASILLMPLFYKIQNLACSPENVKRAEKRKQKEHEEYLEHLKHLH